MNWCTATSSASLPGVSPPRFHVGVVVVPQQIAWVIERLGKFQKVLDPGIHFLVPMVDRVAYAHSLKEEAIAIPNQQAITKDNASYGVHDPFFAVTQLAQTSMRSEIGKMTLDRTPEMGAPAAAAVLRGQVDVQGLGAYSWEALENDPVRPAIVHAVNVAAHAWGIEVLRYEIREMARKSNTIIVPANAGDASSMIAAATSIMKQLGDAPAQTSDIPPADASQSAFNKENVFTGGGHGLTGCKEEAAKKNREAQEKATELLKDLGEKARYYYIKYGIIYHQNHASADGLSPSPLESKANSLDKKAEDATETLKICQDFMKEHGTAMRAGSIRSREPRGTVETLRGASLGIQQGDRAGQNWEMSHVVGRRPWPDDQGQPLGNWIGARPIRVANMTQHETPMASLRKCDGNPKCRAMEYRTSEKRCELWYTPARYHVTVFEDNTVTGKPDFHCFVKSGRCETMKAHKWLGSRCPTGRFQGKSQEKPWCPGFPKRIMRGNRMNHDG
eukprot:Skav227455  [mRNA]  locus=scaffold2491:180832:197681:+ [translate_table: standard]